MHWAVAAWPINISNAVTKDRRRGRFMMKGLVPHNVKQNMGTASGYCKAPLRIALFVAVSNDEVVRSTRGGRRNGGGRAQRNCTPLSNSLCQAVFCRK